MRSRRILLLLVVSLGTGASSTLLYGRTPQDREPAAEREAFSVRIAFDFQEHQRWTGTIRVENATAVQAKGWHFYNKDQLSLNRFELHRTEDRRIQKPLEKGITIQAKSRSGSGARVRVSTDRGAFSVTVAELELDESASFLDGAVEVTRLLPVDKLTDDFRDDDYPSIAVADENTAYAVWQSYSGQADEIRLSKFDRGWRTFTRVPGTSGDVWRPQVALDNRARPWIVWAQQVDGNFDLYARALDEKENRWLPAVRLSTHPFPDVDHHFIADSAGRLWVVWQGFRGDNSDVFLRHTDGSSWSKVVQITDHPANDWEPRIAVDAGGKARIVWDTYRNGNYDVFLRSYDNGALGPEVAVADTPLFEAHASVAVDKQGRTWVAWDETGANWGKDTGATDDRNWLSMGLDRFIKDPGFPGTRLNDSRQMNLVVLGNGERMAPVQELRALLAESGIENHDYPQLFVDSDSGRVALLFHRWRWVGDWDRFFEARPQVYWEQAVLFYEGSRWSKLWTMPESWARPSVRSAAAFAPGGALWTIWPAEGRLYRSPYQPQESNVYATRIPLSGTAKQLDLRPATRPPSVEVPEVHRTESSDVSAIRGYRTFIHGVENRIVRGDFHRHTELSGDNGGLRDGSLFDFYRYMIDAAAMDFGGVTDHNSGGDYEYWWWLIEKTCDLYHIPRAFTTFYAYERSVTFPRGHRNIFHTRRGVPVVSFFTETDLRNARPWIGANSKLLVENDTQLLYESLRQSGGLAISHTTGSLHGGTDWKDVIDPKVEPVVEIYQGGRLSYEKMGAPRAPRTIADFPIKDLQEEGFVWNAYRKGYRIGTIASSDHWSTHISYAMVYTEQPTRDSIFEAIQNRRTYGATDNIILDYRMGEHFMGEEFSTSEVPAMEIRIVGTTPIAEIEIIRNEKVVYSSSPNQKEVNVTYRDQDPVVGSSYYFVRVIQDDWEMAWGSPIWIQYTP